MSAAAAAAAAKPRPKARAKPKAKASLSGEAKPKAALLERAESGKSGARNFFLKKYCPNSTRVGAVFSESMEAETCVIDSSQSLKSLNPERNTQTPWAVQNGMINDARHAFRAFPKMRTAIMCFDRYRRVALCKDVEHAERTRTSGGAGAVPADFEMPGLHEQLSEGFAAVIHDRHVWIPKLIAWLCKQWCGPCPPDFLHSAGQRLVIDGHCLTYGDLEGVAVHPDAPLVLERLGDGTLKVDFLDDLAHLHGEGDLSMLYLLSELAENNSAVLLYSVDSDLMWYLLRLLEKSQKTWKLFMRYRPGLSWCVSPNPVPDIQLSKEPQTWIHVNRLKIEIQSYEPLRKIPLEHRVGTMAVLVALAGNDFVDSIPWVPVHHFLKAYFNNMEYIGDIVGGDNNALYTNPWALARLTDCAAQQAALRGEEIYRAGASEKKVSKHMPGELDLAYRSLHLDLFLRIMDSIGEPAFKEPLLCHYGYARIDRSRPVGRGNLCRLHKEGDEPDSWEFQGHVPPLASRGKL